MNRCSIEDRAASLFLAVYNLPRERRETILAEDSACPTDVRVELDSLIAAHERNRDGFLERPPFGTSYHLNADALAAETFGPPEPVDHPVAIGPYRVIRTLACGESCTVYLADQDEPVKRTVAVKVLHSTARRSEVLRRFSLERQAVAAMQHPNIAQLLDAGTSDSGRAYFAMEYVAGKSITEFCRAERLSSNDRMRLFTQVCRALEHAHQRGIIHRDLKPANILVCRGDNGETLAKVIDFGVAKAILTQSERNAATAVGALVGTIAYMSPEQLSGRTDAVDTRTDVYALGLILRELLSDAPAFNLDEMDQREAVAMLLHERPAPLGSVCPEFRGDASTIVDRAVAPLSADRYPSVAALRTDIELFLAGRPILSRSPGLLYVGGKFLRRNRTATSLSLIAILLTGGAVWKAWRAQSQRLDVAIKVAQAWFDETRAMERTVGESGKRGPLVERLAQQAAMFDAIDPNDPRVRAIHAAVLAEQGSVALGDGDFVKADAAYRAALQIREELARIAPGDHQRQMDLSIALVQVGDLAGAQQDAQTMLAFYNRALAIDESEASRLPENSRALSNLGWSFDRLAYHALYSGERDRAGELFRRECEVFSQEALLGPCVDAERGQSSAFCGLFYIADKGGPQSERLLYSHSCLEHIRTAFRLAPTDRHVLQSLVGAELTWLVARDMPDVGTNAFSEISDIVHHAQQLYDWDPSDLAALNMLATVLNKAVSVAQHVKESAAALRYSEQAVACAELLVARQPGDVDAQRLLVLCRTTHADAAKP